MGSIDYVDTLPLGRVDFVELDIQVSALESATEFSSLNLGLCTLVYLIINQMTNSLVSSFPCQVDLENPTQKLRLEGYFLTYLQ